MSEYTKLVEEARANVNSRAKLAGITENTSKDFIVKELEVGIERDDWYIQSAIFEMACSIGNPDAKATILNTLLLIPGHSFHQEVAREIQQLGHPSSISIIDKILSDGFGIFEYTCSEDAVIAKWFSHALADIGTNEAIQVIQKYASSSNQGVANEMQYRLKRMRDYSSPIRDA